MTCGSSDGVHNVEAYAVRIRAAQHGDEQMGCLDKLDSVDCNAAVNRQRDSLP